MKTRRGHESVASYKNVAKASPDDWSIKGSQSALLENRPDLASFMLI
jgi:hypothetical protein